MDNNIIIVIGSGFLALIFAFWKKNWIEDQDEGTDQMKKIGKSIADGAMAFLKAEYKILSVFVIAIAILLGIANVNQPDSDPLISLSFVVGALASGLA